MVPYLSINRNSSRLKFWGEVFLTTATQKLFSEKSSVCMSFACMDSAGFSCLSTLLKQLRCPLVRLRQIYLNAGGIRTIAPETITPREIAPGKSPSRKNAPDDNHSRGKKPPGKYSRPWWILPPWKKNQWVQICIAAYFNLGLEGPEFSITLHFKSDLYKIMTPRERGRKGVNPKSDITPCRIDLFHL